MFLDRRAKERETVGTLAEYKILGVSRKLTKSKTRTSWVKAPLLDISILGCALASPSPIKPSVALSVKIDPLAFALEAAQMRKDALEMTGKVTSCIAKGPDYYRLGICFTSLKPKDSSLIKRFIKIKERRKFPRWDMSRH